MTIVVFCELQDETALALIAQAKRMAPQAHVIALLEERGAAFARYGACGADEAVTLPLELDDCAQAQAVAQALQNLSPDIALFSATVRGRFLSAWAAASLETGLTADCTDLFLTPDGLLRQVRPAYGGSLKAEILCKTHRPQMASVRPGIFEPPKTDGGCGHFIGLNDNFHFTSEFCWAQSAKRQLNSFIPIPNHVCFNLLHKVLQCNTLPRATVEHLVLHPPEESLTG